MITANMSGRAVLEAVQKARDARGLGINEGIAYDAEHPEEVKEECDKHICEWHSFKDAIDAPINIRCSICGRPRA